MPYAIDSALDDADIQVIERNDDLGEYMITIGSLETYVYITISLLPDGQRARFERSHAIHTPVQAGPYLASRPYWDDLPYALHQAISGLTQYYRAAIAEGHKPQESWLVE